MKLFYTSFFLLIMSFAHAQDFEIYVSDAGNFNNPPWQILKFDQNGQNPSVFIDNNLNWPQDILFLEDQNIVLISNLGSGRITRHNASTGTFISDFATGIAGPTRIKIGPDSLLYVLQWNGAGIVKRYELDGTFVSDFTTVGVPQSIGLDWDSDKNLYVSSYNGDLVRKFDSTGADQGVFINTNLVGPTNIWFANNGDLLVSDYDGGSIKRFGSTGNFKGVFISGLRNSEGIAYMPSGNILIGNGGTSSVKMFDANGTFIKDLVPPGTASLKNPNAVVIRSTSTVSITPAIKKKQGIVYPNTGTEFRFFPEIFDTSISLDVHTASGSHLITIKERSWQADGVAEGVYIVVAKLRDGGVITQRVVVQK